MPDVGSARLLLEKYRTIERLRTEHPRPAQKTRAVDQRRQQMQSLAASFPGALRQLEVLAPEIVAERISALEAAVRGEDVAPAFVALEHALHEALRNETTRRGVGKKWQRALEHVAAAFAVTPAALEALFLGTDARQPM